MIFFNLSHNIARRQGGGIPIYSVLRSSSSVKVQFTEKKFIMALHLFYNCGFYR